MSVKAGALRFNTDSLKMELFDGNQWVEIVATSPEAQTGGARGLFGGGTIQPGSTITNAIQYTTISSTGNAIDFGDLSTVRTQMSSCSSRTRGVFAGGTSVPVETNTIEYITISSTGDALDFGDLTQVRRAFSSGCSSSTRGIFAGGLTNVPATTTYNIIDYITIASLGDSKDFGDLTTSRYATSGCSSSTRGIFMGGANIIDFTTISSLGNAADFGDTLASSDDGGACSNSIRGLYALTTSTNNVIEFVTISTLGNSQDFGDLTAIRSTGRAASSPIRGIFGGGASGSPYTSYNIIDYVQIMTTGNAIDFGDLTNAVAQTSALSNGHGGL